MPASYNGIEFDFVFVMFPSANENARQINTYPGANGLEVIDHGTRGGSTIAQVGFLGPVATINASMETFRDLQLGGQPHTLVDTKGRSWPNVILVGLREIAPARPISASVASYAIRAELTFLHI